jgi:esterase
MPEGGLGCGQAKSRTFDARGLELHALESGAPGAPGIFFLHGGSAHAHWFDALTPRFAERCHVVALDQRGHGRSAWPDPPAYATEDFAADLVAVADALDWERFALVGHSMGGHNALALAAWHPQRVAALVVLDARPALAPDRLARMRERGLRGLRGHASPEALVGAFRLVPPETVADPGLLAHLAVAGACERDGRWVYRFDPSANWRRQPVDAWPLLDRIVAPTLLVRGAGSPILTADIAGRLRGAVRGSTLVEVPGTYHHLLLDDPPAVVAALDVFLDSHGF